MRRLGWVPVAALAIAAGASATPALADGQNGTTLGATVTATPHQTLTYAWSLGKTASPGTLDMFTGDSKSAQYTVTATRDQGTRAAWIDGQVCVTNGGAVATENLAITAVVTMPPSTTSIGSSLVDVSGQPGIAAGATQCYSYKVDIQNANVGATYRVTADVTITNHSGHLGSPFGPNPSETDIMPSATPVHGSLNVTDTNDGSWMFTDSGSQTYSKKFSCDSGSGTQTNTVTSAYADDQKSGPSASAQVTVNCYALAVSKTASTSLDRTWAWTIAKSADQSSLTLALGQTFPVNYTITVTSKSADSNWAAAGQITVNNPAPIAATINSVADAVGSATATVDCGESFPYSLAAGGDLTCNYTVSLPDATGGTNTATATLQNRADSTPSGTTDFTGTAAVDFGNAAINKVDATATVSDDYAGSSAAGLPAAMNASDTPKTFTYTRQAGPYASPGSYTVDNTATVVATDTKTTSSSSVSIPVTVPSAGCTLTIGYWKTHPGATAKLLPIWLGTPGGAKSIQVTTAPQATTTLSFNGDASNGINKLDGQLLGAKVSIATGADSSAVASTIGAADAFLATHNSADWASLTKTQKTQVLGWATTLDNYNNGLTGPGHCSQ
jgi:hypothetical protein